MITKILIIETIAIAIMVVILTIVSKITKSIQTENNQLKNDLIKANANLTYLYTHAEEIEKIKTQEKKTSKEIKNAKSDKEILDIINTIVSNNNSKLCK